MVGKEIFNLDNPRYLLQCCKDGMQFDPRLTQIWMSLCKFNGGLQLSEKDGIDLFDANQLCDLTYDFTEVSLVIKVFVKLDISSIGLIKCKEYFFV